MMGPISFFDFSSHFPRLRGVEIYAILLTTSRIYVGQLPLRRYMQTSKILYVDMDDTLFNFTDAYQRARAQNPEQIYPQSQIGFFLNLEPLPGAIDAYRQLKDAGYHVMFLTAPSVRNPLCYTEKRLSIEKHFGLDACYDLIIAQDKSLLLGGILIDDRVDSNKQNLFQGRLIQYGSESYPTWRDIVQTLILGL